MAESHITKMASPTEEPTKLSLTQVKLEVETTFETKITVDNFMKRRERAMEMLQGKGNEEVTEKTDGKATAESIFSDTVTLHSVEGDTYRVQFEVRLNCDVSPKSH